MSNKIIVNNIALFKAYISYSLLFQINLLLTFLEVYYMEKPYRLPYFSYYIQLSN